MSAELAAELRAFPKTVSRYGPVAGANTARNLITRAADELDRLERRLAVVEGELRLALYVRRLIVHKAIEQGVTAESLDINASDRQALRAALAARLEES